MLQVWKLFFSNPVSTPTPAFKLLLIIEPNLVFVKAQLKRKSGRLQASQSSSSKSRILNPTLNRRHTRKGNKGELKNKKKNPYKNWDAEFKIRVKIGIWIFAPNLKKKKINVRIQKNKIKKIKKNLKKLKNDIILKATEWYKFSAAPYKKNKNKKNKKK